MKRIFQIFLVTALFTISNSVSAQNVAIGIHAGFSLQKDLTSSNLIYGLPVGVNVEWAFNAKHSFGARLHYNQNWKGHDKNLYYGSGEYKYYPIGETLDGFYTGGYLGFGGASNSGYVSIGTLAGYSFYVAEMINLEANIQVGYGNYTGINLHVLHLTPSIGVRFAL